MMTMAIEKREYYAETFIVVFNFRITLINSKRIRQKKQNKFKNIYYYFCRYIFSIVLHYNVMGFSVCFALAYYLCISSNYK